MAEFHNPYNFVPALARETQKNAANPFGDGPGPGHHRYHNGHWTGRLHVRMTVETPLVLCDRPREPKATDPKDHKVYPVRRRVQINADGSKTDIPDVRRSEVKGMLRSAFEMVTNARFGVFPFEVSPNPDKHGARLPYRMSTDDPYRFVPAIVRHGQVELLPGDGQAFSEFLRNGKPGRRLPSGQWDSSWTMYGAWLRRYGHGATALMETGEPRHLQEVRFSAWRFKHQRGFRAWQVHEVTDVASALVPGLPAVLPSVPRHEAIPASGAAALTGWVCVNNQNIDRKHDERVFFNSSGTSWPTALTDDLARDWVALIDDYASTNDKKMKARQKELEKRPGPAPTTAELHGAYATAPAGEAAISAHIYEPGRRDLRSGTHLCYAWVRWLGAPGRYEIKALLPVNLSRNRHDLPPLDLLDPSLRPAGRREEMSPADRVFGWVSQQGRAAGGRERVQAYRGHAVVRTVRMIAAPQGGAVESFSEPGLPLAILGQPKPAQGRFYVGKADGTAQPDDGTKEDRGYGETGPEGAHDDDGTYGKALRGRKIYPHHRHLSPAPEGYWATAAMAPALIAAVPAPEVGGVHREYLRPLPTAAEWQQDANQRDSQNRSILGWVKPGTQFGFEIDVDNLPPAELGALLFLLTLPQARFHRLGFAKPLGLGSIRLDLIGLDLRDGASEKAWYQSLGADPAPGTGVRHRVNPDADLAEAAAIPANDGAVNGFVAAFKAAARAVVRPPPTGQDWPGFVKAFLDAAHGVGSTAAPVHYPRTTVSPQTSGENFKWFVANERKAKPDEVPTRRSLPAIGGTLPRYTG